MDTRRKRFFAAASYCQSIDAKFSFDDNLLSSPEWSFRQSIHPFDDLPMAIADLPMELHGEYDTLNPQIRYDASLYLTAVRLANSTEVSAGIGISLYGSQSDSRHSILGINSCTGFVHCWETAPAYVETARLRVNWKFASRTSKPDVAVFRAIPRVTHLSETILFIEKQMSPTWARGEPDDPVDESALSARTAPLAPGDKMVVGIPWLHRDHELTAIADISNLNHVVSKVKELVAPSSR